MIRAEEALERLREGNRRFRDTGTSSEALTDRTRRGEVAEGQEPFAIIVGCADSRVPAEIIFDQGRGDLFVIRVAGNIVPPSQIGSVEFAVAQFGSRLVVVLGHAPSGAITAPAEQWRRPMPDQSTTHANIRLVVNQLQHASRNLEHHIQHGGLLIVGAEYSSETGTVDVFERQ